MLISPNDNPFLSLFITQFPPPISYLPSPRLPFFPTCKCANRTPHSTGNLTGFPGGIKINAIICLDVTINAPSAGRRISNPHQNLNPSTLSNRPVTTNSSPKTAGFR